MKEIRRTVCRLTKLEFVPLREVQYEQGFASAFAFDEAIVQQLRDNNDVDIRHVPVYSDILLIDFDSEEGIHELCERLMSLGISFWVYDTGNRGLHYHVQIEPMVGATVPYSQKKWAEENAPGCDLTVYNHRSIFRLPGTWHEKNPGHKKELLFVTEGGPLTIPLVTPPPPTHIPASYEKGDRTQSDFFAQILTTQESPGRNERLFALGLVARDCGIGEDAALESVLWWAENRCSPPLRIGSGEIRRQFMNGYRS